MYKRGHHIRDARPEEYTTLGELIVEAYAGLPGMPKPGDQPEYYALLRKVAERASKPALTVFVAVDDAGTPLGCVDFIDDMQSYGAGGTARKITDAAGIRLLAVAPEHRGRGLGKQLALFCVQRARGLGRSRVILHTTMAMTTAWSMYERMGFMRLPEIDFRQGALDVFGFQLALRS